MKLEHLAPYLPYGLKIECNTDEEIKKYGSYVSKIVSLHLNGVDDEYGNNWGLDVRPILRPLSDLTKEIEHYSYKFIPIEKIKESQHHLFFRTDLNNSLLGLQYEEMQKLFAWHFDVFGLIEKGEAIDINTL